MCIRDRVSALECVHVADGFSQKLRGNADLRLVLTGGIRKPGGIFFVRTGDNSGLVDVDDFIARAGGEVLMGRCAVKDAEVQLPYHHHVKAVGVERTAVGLGAVSYTHLHTR